MNKLKKLFRRSKSPKTLKLEFSPFKARMYSSRKQIIIGDKLYMRKDFVEERMVDVINAKIAKGELKKVQSLPVGRQVQSSKFKVQSKSKSSTDAANHS